MTERKSKVVDVSNPTIISGNPPAIFAPKIDLDPSTVQSTQNIAVKNRKEGQA